MSGAPRFRLPYHIPVIERGERPHGAFDALPDLTVRERTWERRLAKAWAVLQVVGMVFLQLVVIGTIVVGALLLAIIHGAFGTLLRSNTAQARTAADRRWPL